MNRTVMSARADHSPRINKSCALLIPVPMPSAPGPVRNRKAPRMTSTQRNSVGRSSEWSRSPYFWTDSKWSA